MTAAAPPRATQPWWVRLTHWLTAASVILMATSGWRIYDANPFLGFQIPPGLTLGGWLGGALQWHFAAMWLFGASFLTYLTGTIVTGRLARKFFPVSPGAVIRDLLTALRGKLSHDDLGTYNAVQKLAYLFAIADMIVLLASGLVLWKSVQFPFLRDLMFGYEGARRVHFFAMAGLVGFFFVHVAMALLVPRTIVLMITGRADDRGALK